MRVTTRALLALPLLLVAWPVAFADEAADKLAAQKKNADENWEALETGPAAQVETAHLLVYAPKSYDKRIKEVGAALEKYYEQARKPLGYEKDAPWPGKIAVYLIPEREDFTKFVRRVEKRRVEAEDAGSHLVEGDFPHAVGGPPRAKTDPSVEGQAGEQLATAHAGQEDRDQGAAAGLAAERLRPRHRLPRQAGRQGGRRGAAQGGGAGEEGT